MESYSSKTERVYKALLENIIERKLLPGQRLLERDLIQKLGVSKTPIREALVRLREDGLVEGTLYQSAFVARILRKDAAEIYDLRRILEGLAARCAAEKITPKQAKKLRSIIQLSEECIKENKVKEYTHLDLKFHSLVGEISESGRLCKVMRQLRYQTNILMATSVTLPGRGVKVSLSEHKKVVEAIVNQNPELAEKMAEQHVIRTKEAVMDWFDRTQW